MVTLSKSMGGAYKHFRHEGLHHHGRCTRPIWGDGFVDGIEFQLCSLCWHNWAAFHSHYRLMQLNPAAAAITDMALEKLFVSDTLSFDRKGAVLPPLGSIVPDCIPAEWVTSAVPDTFPEGWLP